MGVFDEPIDALTSALYQWDFSPAFPSDYPTSKGVVVAHGWPYQLIQQLEGTTGGQMTEYLITILELTPTDDRIRLGSVMGAGATPPQTRYGHRVTLPYLVSCWADQRLGGMDAARKIAGQVYGCVLWNENRLGAYRNLKTDRGTTVYEPGSQLYHFDVTVEGSTIASIDA
jgi:hypothetical protein